MHLKSDRLYVALLLTIWLLDLVVADWSRSRDDSSEEMERFKDFASSCYTAAVACSSSCEYGCKLQTDTEAPSTDCQWNCFVPPDNKPGLQTGAIIGITVVCGLVVALWLVMHYCNKNGRCVLPHVGMQSQQSNHELALRSETLPNQTNTLEPPVRDPLPSGGKHEMPNGLQGSSLSIPTPFVPVIRTPFSNNDPPPAYPVD